MSDRSNSKVTVKGRVKMSVKSSPRTSVWRENLLKKKKLAEKRKAKFEGVKSKVDTFRKKKTGGGSSDSSLEEEEEEGTKEDSETKIVRFNITATDNEKGSFAIKDDLDCLVGLSVYSEPNFSKLIKSKEIQLKGYGVTECEIKGEIRPVKNSKIISEMADNALKKTTGNTRKPKEFPCDVCGKLYTRPETVLKHKEEVHKQDGFNPAQVSTQTWEDTAAGPSQVDVTLAEESHYQGAQISQVVEETMEEDEPESQDLLEEESGFDFENFDDTVREEGGGLNISGIAGKASSTPAAPGSSKRKASPKSGKTGKKKKTQSVSSVASSTMSRDASQSLFDSPDASMIQEQGRMIGDLKAKKHDAEWSVRELEAYRVEAQQEIEVLRGELEKSLKKEKTQKLTIDDLRRNYKDLRSEHWEAGLKAKQDRLLHTEVKNSAEPKLIKTLKAEIVRVQHSNDQLRKELKETKELYRASELSKESFKERTQEVGRHLKTERQLTGELQTRLQTKMTEVKELNALIPCTVARCNRNICGRDHGSRGRKRSRSRSGGRSRRSTSNHSNLSNVSRSSAANNYRVKPCKFHFVENNCRFGSGCRWYHNITEETDMAVHDEHIQRYLQENEGRNMMPPPTAGHSGKKPRVEGDEMDEEMSGNDNGGEVPVDRPTPRKVNYRTTSGQLKGMKQESRKANFRKEVDHTMRRHGAGQSTSRGQADRYQQGWEQSGQQQIHQGSWSQHQHQRMMNPPPPLGVHYPAGIVPLHQMGPMGHMGNLSPISPTPFGVMEQQGQFGPMVQDFQGNQGQGSNQRNWRNHQRGRGQGSGGHRGRRGRF